MRKVVLVMSLLSHGFYHEDCPRWTEFWEDLFSKRGNPLIGYSCQYLLVGRHLCGCCAPHPKWSPSYVTPRELGVILPPNLGACHATGHSNPVPLFSWRRMSWGCGSYFRLVLSCGRRRQSSQVNRNQTTPPPPPSHNAPLKQFIVVNINLK